jgi:hypothetical protein
MWYCVRATFSACPALGLTLLLAGCGTERPVERLGELRCEVHQRVEQDELDRYVEHITTVGRQYGLVTRIDKDTQQAVAKHSKQDQLFLYLVAPGKEADVLVLAVTNPAGEQNYMQQVYGGALKEKELTAICTTLREDKSATELGLQGKHL